jgi:glucose-1-phosphate thymidylyltransferase
MRFAMKGVVLAGGLGTRFHPVTKVVNKHLLDVFDEPMIFYPIRTLASAGVTDLVIVTGKEMDQFKALLGDGSSLGVDLEYARQDEELGIAHALLQARAHVGDDRMVVILGDNIYQEDLSSHVAAFAHQPQGAKLLLKRVSPDDARRFGVATVEEDRIVSIAEKPQTPASDLVVTGCYMYDSGVWEKIERLQPSSRGEYEISDVNNAYARAGTMTFEVLSGWWTDAGMPASKLKASLFVAMTKGVTFHA